MDRRGFFGTAGAAICGSIIFPRRTQSAQAESLSHEEMAQLILTHPHNVCLGGDTNYFGRTRNYHYADADDPFDLIVNKVDEVSEWAIAGNCIGSDCTWGEPIWSRRIRFVVGSRVEVQSFGFGVATGRKDYNRIDHEEWFEISNPLLKVIHFVGDPDWQEDRLMPRYFARSGQRWVEV